MTIKQVIKADGTRELFNEEKLKNSLLRSKASEPVVNMIVTHLLGEMEDNMTTHQIYRHAFSLLKKMEKPAASKYSLRRAIMELGPTGFPFEKFIAEILREKGFEAKSGVIVKGGCVDHEVDLVAWNESKLIMAEAKFHNILGMKTDLKVALYVKARFDDLATETFEYGHRRKVDESWIITNTKFTSAAIEYGMCKGLTMIGWNYPQKGNLQDMIESSGVHPITCLSTLPKHSATELLQNGVVLCKKISEQPHLLQNLGLTEKKVRAILDEIKTL